MDWRGEGGMLHSQGRYLALLTARAFLLAKPFEMHHQIWHHPGSIENSKSLEVYSILVLPHCWVCLECL